MKTKRGGKRPNSGAKQKYGEETEVISFRCPKSAVCTFQKLIKSRLKKYEKIQSK